MDRKISIDDLRSGACLKRLCDEIGIPDDRRDRFAKAVHLAVKRYDSRCNGTTPKQVEIEFGAIAKRASTARKLSSHKTSRPGEIQKALTDISDCLAKLSFEGLEQLSRWSIRLIRRGEPLPADYDVNDDLIDPLLLDDCFERSEAINILEATLSMPVANQKKGRPVKYSELILFNDLDVAYSRATGKMGSDKSDHFMRLCLWVKDRCGLTAR